MKEKITLYGKIGFEPENKTKKHDAQSSWKRMAMVHFNGDESEYYAWFILKRYNLTLNQPIRGAHISFINDSLRDLSLNGNRTIEEIDSVWDAVKKKWDRKKIPITLDISPHTDGNYWWFNIIEEDRVLLQGIRNELGLGRPFWGLHMTIGYVNEKNLFHSQYIHDLIKKGFITT